MYIDKSAVDALICSLKRRTGPGQIILAGGCMTLLMLASLPAGAQGPTAGAPKADGSFNVSVAVDASKHIRTVPPLLFGQNIEWTSSGDGLWDTAQRRIRPDVLPLLHSVEPGLIRFPGGSLSNSYQWQFAVGPVANRQPIDTWFSTNVAIVNGKWTLQSKSAQTPTYGFDEQMSLVKQCAAAGALITVNATSFPGSPQWSGTAQQAAAWVAYANSRLDGPDVNIGVDSVGRDWHTSRYWAQQRAHNGHPAPYHVAYWEIGNEVDLGGQGAGLTGPTYAARVHEYAVAMHKVDPSIKVGAVLGFNWLPDILQAASHDIDFLIYHHYGPGMDEAGATFYSNGERTCQVNFPAPPQQLAITAAGTPAAGGWPEMVVRVDGKEVHRFVVGQETASVYTVDLSLPAGPHNVTIGFTNDLMANGEDRNLFVHSAAVEAGGQSHPIQWMTPQEMMQRLADQPAQFAAGFDRIRQAIDKYAPDRKGQISVFVTEFNAMYTLNDPAARQIKDLKSAVMVDAILQRAIEEPLCQETNFWCLNSWWFRIVELTPDAAFLSPAGLVYKLYVPFHHGWVVGIHTTSPPMGAPGAVPATGAAPAPGASRPAVTAVAVVDNKTWAVNLANFDPSRSARVTVTGLTGACHCQAVTGPDPEAMNDPLHPRQVHIADIPVTRTPAGIEVTLPPCSAAILEKDVK